MEHLVGNCQLVDDIGNVFMLKGDRLCRFVDSIDAWCPTRMDEIVKPAVVRQSVAD